MANKVRLIKTFRQTNNSADKEALIEVQEFDEHGNIIYNKEYDENEELLMELRAEFDAKGKPIKETSINHIDDIEEIKTYEYNESGKLLSERTDNKQGWFSIKKYERLDDGKTVRVSMFDEDDKIEEITEVKINENGNIISNKVFNEYNKLTEAQKNKYNDEGILILREELDPKGKLEKAHHYYYTDTNKIEAVKTLNRKGKTLDWVKIEYDETNRPIEQFSMSGAKLKMVYKEDGSVVESQFSPGGEETNSHTDFFDENNNLIKQEYNEYIIKYVYEFF